MSQVLFIGLLVFAVLSIESGILFSRHVPKTYARRIASCTTYASLLVLWPLLFDCLVGMSLLRRVPMLWFSLLWPFALISLNIGNASRARDTKVHNRGHVQLDVNAIAGFCFAIGGLVSSQMGKHVGITTNSIFTTAFLLCIAFIMPSPEVPDDVVLSVVVETTQQSFLHFAIALLISGVVLNLSYGIKAADKREEYIDKALSTPFDTPS